MRRLVFFVSALAIAASIPAGSISGAPGSLAASGLRGIVTLTPTRPVCIEGRPCSKPASFVELAFRRNGAVAKRITTRGDGTYRVLLRPGLYVVVAPSYRVGSGVTPRTVRVPRARLARVDLQIDTGIQ